LRVKCAQAACAGHRGAVPHRSLSRWTLRIGGHSDDGECSARVHAPRYAPLSRVECVVLVRGSVLVKSRRDLSVPCAVRGFRATVPVSQSVIFRGLARSLPAPPSLSTRLPRRQAGSWRGSTHNTPKVLSTNLLSTTKVLAQSLVGYSIIAVRSFALMDYPDSASGARRNSGDPCARCARKYVTSCWAGFW
jgi:hypothetical protein